MIKCQFYSQTYLVWDPFYCSLVNNLGAEEGLTVVKSWVVQRSRACQTGNHSRQREQGFVQRKRGEGESVAWSGGYRWLQEHTVPLREGRKTISVGKEAVAPLLEKETSRQISFFFFFFFFFFYYYFVSLIHPGWVATNSKKCVSFSEVSPSLGKKKRLGGTWDIAGFLEPLQPPLWAKLCWAERLWVG